MEEILGPKWPLSLSRFVSSLLYWDPQARLTSTEALQHQFLGHPQSPQSAQLSSSSGPAGPAVNMSPPQADGKKGFFKNVQQSLQRGPSIASTRSNVSCVAAKELKELHNSGPDNIPIETNNGTGTHRQSWFAKKRDSIIGRRISVLVADDAPANNTRSKAREGQLKDVGELSDVPYSRSSSIIGSPGGKSPGSLMLPQNPPISPLVDLGHHRKPDWLQNHESAMMGHSEAHGSLQLNFHQGQSGDIILSSAEPASVLELQNTRKPSRSISDYSSEQQCPTSTKPHIQKAEHHGIGGLFSHLRKKTKRSEQSVTSDKRTFGNARDTRTSLNRARSPPRRVPVTHDVATKGSRPIGKPRNSAYYTDRNVPKIHLTQSLPAMSTAMHRGALAAPLPIRDRSSGIPCHSATGPVSSRTRKATNDASRVIQPEIRDVEAELLKVELQSTAHAMKHLEATHDSSQNITRPVPSYARSTVSSSRRASNIHNASNAASRSANKRMIEHRIQFPPSPPSGGLGSSCAGHLMT